MRYLISLIVAAGIVLASAAAANYWIDPAQLFHSGYEAQIARSLIVGKAINTRPNYDERLLQKIIIDGQSIVPEVVAFGSSRAMQLTQENFGQQKFFNHSVSGATLEDHLAIYQLYRNKSHPPGLLIFQVDAWLFNKNYISPTWQTLREEYEKIAYDLGQHGTQPATNDRLVQLVSLRYLVASLGAARNGLSSRGAATTDETASLDSDLYARRSDGSLAMPASERSRTVEQIRANALLNLTPPVYGLETFRQIDQVAWKLFSALLKLQLKEGTRPTLLLAPYHPRTYAALISKAEYRMIMDVEASLRRLAMREGLVVLGSYDPALANCSEMEFFDGMHPTESCLKRILAGHFPGAP